MMSQAVEELEALLQRAAAHVFVQGRGRQLPVPETREWVRLLRSKRKRFVPEPHLAYGHKFDISDSAIKTNIVEFLRQTLGPHLLDDRILSAGNFVASMPGEGFHLEDFVSKLLELTAVWGPARAAQMAIDSLDETVCKSLWICLLDGIRLNETVEVCEGIRLEPIALSDGELPPYLHDFALHSSAQHLTAALRNRNAALLVLDTVISPKFLNPARGPQTTADPDPFRISGATPEVHEFDRADFVNVLSLALNPDIAQIASWWFIPDDDMANVGLGASTGGVSYIHRDVQGSPPVAVVDSGFSEAVQIYSALASLPADKREKIDIPLHRLIGASGRRSLADKIVDLGVALESLYLDGRDGELSYRLAIRAAKHLGTDTASRLQIYNELRDFYGGLRSRAVHSGKVPATVKMNGKHVDSHQAAERVHELCRRAVRRVISEGFPDWEHLLLSDSDVHSRA